MHRAIVGIEGWKLDILTDYGIGAAGLIYGYTCIPLFSPSNPQ